MPTSSRCRNYPKCTVFVVRTIRRFAVRADVGIGPYKCLSFV